MKKIARVIAALLCGVLLMSAIGMMHGCDDKKPTLKVWAANVDVEMTKGFVKDFKGHKQYISKNQIEFGDGQKKVQIDDLINLKKELYGTNEPSRKKDIIDKIQSSRKELLRLNFLGTNKEKELFEIDKSHNKPYFAWMLEFIEVFIENDGFDIVIGNPPYVDSEHMVKDEELLKTRELCNKLYESAKGNWDLFIVFVELGYKNLNNNGNVSFIIPNKIIASNYAKMVRKIISNNSLIEIRDYSNVNVFKEAAVYPITFISNMYDNVNGEYVRMIKMKDMLEIEWENDINRELFKKNENWDNFFAKNSKANDIITRVINNNKKLHRPYRQPLNIKLSLNSTQTHSLK